MVDWNRDRIREEVEVGEKIEGKRKTIEIASWRKVWTMEIGEEGEKRWCKGGGLEK